MASELDDIDFATNSDPRCACVLLVDTSYSMDGPKIDSLNIGLDIFRVALQGDELAARRVEVALVSFNNEVRVEFGFASARDLPPMPTLNASGTTHMGSGILQAIDLIRERKKLYDSNGIDYYRPWILLITDGEPQGEPPAIIDQASSMIRQLENENGVAFFAVGVDQANMNKLATISVRAPLHLTGLKFQELFVWLSRSLIGVSRSRVNDMVALPPATGPAGWGTV